MGKEQIWICQDSGGCEQVGCAWKYGVAQKCDYYLRVYYKNRVVYTSGKESILTVPVCSRSLTAIPYEEYLKRKGT